jgi:hypothetical protein
MLQSHGDLLLDGPPTKADNSRVRIKVQLRKNKPA